MENQFRYLDAICEIRLRRHVRSLENHMLFPLPPLAALLTLMSVGLLTMAPRKFWALIVSFSVTADDEASNLTLWSMLDAPYFLEVFIANSKLQLVGIHCCETVCNNCLAENW